ncbi:MAG: WecB/TagA/CpsF family glycosyltransferase [Oscillospiraceae bacterium]|nr:WecB/TagA/CpsF family glycosyltransferase [Oscillospiraceae bacterium]
MIDVLNKIYKGSKESFYETVKEKMEKEEKAFIITANPEIIMIAEKRTEIKEILLSDEAIIIPDGFSVVKRGRNMGVHIEEKIPGIDLVQNFLKFANENNKSIYCYGSKEETERGLEDVLRKTYPNVKIEGLKNGYDYTEEEVFADIKTKKPDIILVAMGVPRQEQIAAKHYDDLEKGIIIGVGGSLDVLSGSKKRAPKFFRKRNLEWLYRILREPRRIKRFYKYNIKFYLQTGKRRRRTK